MNANKQSQYESIASCLQRYSRLTNNVQRNKPPAPAVKNLLSTAPVRRPAPRTPSRVLDAHAELAPLENAPVTERLQRTLPLQVRHANAASARLVRACTCEKAADGGFNPSNEVDFTTK
ncbi:hypothetical protein G7046_g2519 [Stylonectria norvegica]|nr:hypothetical protein G7046_g2519 [Stylonectria norvegica]